MEYRSEEQFSKLQLLIINHPPKQRMSQEEIHFDVLAIQVLELVVGKYVVWLN